MKSYKLKYLVISFLMTAVYSGQLNADDGINIYNMDPSQGGFVARTPESTPLTHVTMNQITSGQVIGGLETPSGQFQLRSSEAMSRYSVSFLPPNSREVVAFGDLTLQGNRAIFGTFNTHAPYRGQGLNGNIASFLTDSAWYEESWHKYYWTNEEVLGNVLDFIDHHPHFDDLNDQEKRLLAATLTPSGKTLDKIGLESISSPGKHKVGFLPADTSGDYFIYKSRESQAGRYFGGRGITYQGYINYLKSEYPKRNDLDIPGLRLACKVGDPVELIFSPIETAHEIADELRPSVKRRMKAGQGGFSAFLYSSADLALQSTLSAATMGAEVSKSGFHTLINIPGAAIGAPHELGNKKYNMLYDGSKGYKFFEAVGRWWEKDQEDVERNIRYNNYGQINYAGGA